MAVWQRANPIIHRVSFIIVRAKGHFILFDGVEFKRSSSKIVDQISNLRSLDG